MRKIKNVLIYGSTVERAFNKLQELIDNMNPNDIKRIKKSPSCGIYTVELHNGDYYKAIKASDNARGYRWQYTYIDTDIDKELLDCVIACKFIPENLDRNIHIKDCYEWY